MTVRLRALPTAAKALVTILIAGLFLLGLQAPAAHAAGPVTFTVTLTSKTGAAITAANVVAYPIANPGNVEIPDPALWKVASPVSGKPGQYRFEDSQELDSAYRYALFFDSPSSVTTAFDQFYGGTTFIEDAQLVQPTGSGNSLSVSLATNATITGSVKNTSAKGIAGVTVYPWRWVDGDWYQVTDSAVTTSSTGAYTLRNLEPGSYRLEFDANRTGYLSEYSGNTTVFSSAAGYFAALGSSQAVNASLSLAGTLSGTLALQDLSGDPIEASGLVAWAYPVVGSGNAIDPDGPVYVSNVTGTAGTWTIRGLPAGTYVVRFEDLLNDYRTEWSVNQAGRLAATPHVVSLGKTTTAAKTTLLEADTSGTTVPDTSLDLEFTYGGITLADAEIYITSDDGFFMHLMPDDGYSDGYQVSGEPGHYFIRSLDPGAYDIFVDPFDNDIAPYSTTITIDPAAGTQDVHAALVSGAGGLVFTAPGSVNTSAAKLGTSYTVTPGAVTGSSVEFSYQWMHDLGQGPEPIAGATGAVYSSRPADVGHELSVLVRADRRGVDPAFQRVIAASPVTPGDAPNAVSLPGLTSTTTPVPGVTLNALAGTWDAGNERPKFEYTWTRNPGVDDTVVGTASSYKLVPADAGQTIGLSVTASAAGHDGPTSESGGEVAIGSLAAPVVTKNPKITATGSKYTLSSTTWSPSGTASSYVWKANGAPIAGATASSLICTPTLCPTSDTIEVTVSGTKLGYATGARTFLIRKGATPPVVLDGAVTKVSDPATELDGTQQIVYGQALRTQSPVLGYPYASGGTVTTKYQWQSSTNGTTWTSITGQTGQNYTPASSMTGKRVRVHLTMTSSTAGTYIHDYPAAGIPIIAQQGLVDAAGSTVHMSLDSYDYNHGAAWRGAITGSWPVTGVTQAFQWYKCDAAALGSVCDDTSTLTAPWIAISGATASAYTPPASLQGYTLAVRLTASKTGYAAAVLRSNAGTVDGPAHGVFVLGAPAISGAAVTGDAKVGTKLTAKYAPADVTGSVSVGRWEYCTDACSSWTDIPGATSTTYTVQPFLAGFTSPRIRFNQFVSVTIGGTPYQNNQPSGSLGVVLNTHAPSVAPTASWNATTHTGTVKPGTWPAGTTFTYDWYEGTMAAPGSSTTSPTLVNSSGDPVWVVLTTHRLGYVDRSYTFYLYKPLPVIAGAAVFGTPDAQYGATLDVSEGSLFTLPDAPSSPAPAYKYQWYSGTTAIKGQTGATFTPGTTYINKAIKVLVTVSSPYFGTRSAYATPLTLQTHAAGVVIAGFSSPGNQGPGDKLTALTSMSSYPAGTVYGYLWQRQDAGVWRTVGTAMTYTVTAADAGKPLKLTMTAAKAGWFGASGSMTSTFSYGTTLAPLVPVSLAPASGAPTPGKALTVSATWNTPGVTVAYAWYHNGQLVPGVTGASWTPPANAWGGNIHADVAVSKPGWLTEHYETNHVVLSLASAAAPTTHPVVSGMTGGSTSPKAPMVGNLLTATTGVWNVDGLTFSYVWKVGGVAVAGATSSAYAVRVDDIGLPVTVEVRAVKRGWTEAVDVISVAAGKPVMAAP